MEVYLRTVNCLDLMLTLGTCFYWSFTFFFVAKLSCSTRFLVYFYNCVSPTPLLSGHHIKVLIYTVTSCSKRIANIFEKFCTTLFWPENWGTTEIVITAYEEKNKNMQCNVNNSYFLHELVSSMESIKNINKVKDSKHQIKRVNKKK